LLDREHDNGGDNNRIRSPARKRNSREEVVRRFDMFLDLLCGIRLLQA
jgi:hypothetical protein